MQYRPLGNSGVDVSVVSFGSMRFPSEEVCHEIINRGLDLGLNYIDTSTGYVDGKSQTWSGRAVRKRRGEMYFSSKSNWATAPSADAVRQAIDTSLAATELDYFDFYQIWGLQTMDVVTQAVAKGGMVEGVRKARQDGLVRCGLGFTFHGPPEVFKAAVDTGEFCCATVSYSLMNPKEEDVIAYAGSKGVGVIIMNPLAGGVLALAGHGSLDFLRGPDGWPGHGALRFLLANRSISTSIVGFTAPEQVDQAVAALDGAGPLDEPYRRQLAAQMDAAKFTQGDFCTGCGYCKDCPNGFNPARFMQAMRDFVVYGVEEGRLAEWLLSKYPHEPLLEKIRLCTECAQCQEKCPQHLEIVEAIRRGKAVLGV